MFNQARSDGDEIDLGKQMVNKTGNGMNPVFLALSRLRRRRFDEVIEACSDGLDPGKGGNPYDEALWFMKTRALVEKQYIDDSELEEEGVAEMLMDENAISKAPRPGTSLKKPMSQARGNTGGGNINRSMRPQSGLSGFARPSTQSRGQTGNLGRDISTAFQNRTQTGSSRPVSVAGRYVRLGTASMLGDGENFINLERDFRRDAKKQWRAKVLMDFCVYHESNFKKALELAAEATKQAEFQDWWWKARLGKSYYQLGLFRDTLRQFESAQKQQEMIITYLELAKTHLRLDQPRLAIQTYKKGLVTFPEDISLKIGIARVYDMLHDVDSAVEAYKEILRADSSNSEAVASLASHHFYNDQPEIALRFFRRLLQIGVQSTELWNNIALCCFYSAQYDMTISCFEKALTLAQDDNMADVWYNIGQMAIGIGDTNLANQAFKIALAADHAHAESFNNLAILQLREGNADVATSYFEIAGKQAPHMFEPFYNNAVLAMRQGNCQKAINYVHRALEVFPDHVDSLNLLEKLNLELS